MDGVQPFRLEEMKFCLGKAAQIRVAAISSALLGGWVVDHLSA